MVQPSAAGLLAYAMLDVRGNQKRRAPGDTRRLRVRGTEPMDTPDNLNRKDRHHHPSRIGPRLLGDYRAESIACTLGQYAYHEPSCLRWGR